ncbi:AraC family transcriptional regulator [Paracoccus zeaxanthinifaciens]|uniref:AraC family transcriptional regulator n=1 Tax=Paracoccus zeaxanthinifaciens TaxID=187400 RepID=UPI0003F75944|nr:AraC family transcriptional regulator [Paracoccus zeaxanthinifaciens]
MDQHIISEGFVRDALVAAGQGGPTRIGPVTASEYGAIWRDLAQRTGCEFFGMGTRPMPPGAFAMMAHAVLDAPDLGRALRRALRFMGMMLTDPQGRLLIANGQARILLEDARGPVGAFAARTYWLIILGLMCWLVGRRLPLSQVDLSCEAPLNRADYQQFFGAPVRFGQGATVLAFDARHLALPVIRDSAQLRGFLQQAPANLLVRYQHDQGLSARLRMMLRDADPVDWPDAAGIAHGFGISAATLRRRLASEGQSLAMIRDDIRFGLARGLLRGPHLPVDEIASRLGYAEPSAFHRAFLKWSGRTPDAFRRENGAGEGT